MLYVHALTFAAPYYCCVSMALNPPAPQICCIAFAFMAGEYSTFLSQMLDPRSQECTLHASKSGPQSLWSWLIHWDACHIFNPKFLVMWGAR